MGLFNRKHKSQIEQPEQPEAVPAPVYWITILDEVSVLVNDFGGEFAPGELIGTVTAIALSPYCLEEQQGIIRLYIEGNGWATWRLLDEIAVVAINQTSIEMNTAA